MNSLMNARFLQLMGWGWVAVLMLAMQAGADPATPVSSVSNSDIVAAMQPFPAKATNAVDALFGFADGSRPAFTPSSTESLVEFVCNASAADSGWELPERHGAAGAAYVVTVRVPLERYLALNFNSRIPDYVVFPSSLRYSECLNSNEMRCAYDCIEAGPTGTQEYVTSRMSGMEEITPNPESGSYFSYTNSRTFVRCKVANRDVLFSCSDTLGPSTFSSRGIPVGAPDQALFYYSGKPGLNLPGMTWMLSQITRSTTLSVYITLNSNETAVATFAWLNAGWKGMNLARACHILNSQKSTLDCSRRIAQHPDVTAPRIASIVDGVSALLPEAVNAEYGKYLAYVKTQRDEEKTGLFCRDLPLHQLFDPRANQANPLTHQRALITQERVRTLLGMPTWSLNTPSDDSKSAALTHPSGKGS
jgi:hypothetical protein